MAEPSRAARERGLLLIVSGPSGSGKSTLVRELLRDGEFPITFSISATSRPPRPGETDGVHYHFLAREEFERRVAEGAFLEHAVVHGNLYGTPKAPVEAALDQGRWVLLEIDVQGYRQVKSAMPEAIGFFVRAPAREGYEERLRGRGTESAESIARRLADADRELAHAAEYDFQIVNESVPQAVRALRVLLWGLESQKGLAHAR